MKGSNCILNFQFKSFTRKGNDVSRIYAPGADKSTLPAKHAFADNIMYLIILTPFKKNLKFSQAERSKIAGGTCGSAATALDTDVKTWLLRTYVISNRPVVAIVIDMPPF